MIEIIALIVGYIFISLLAILLFGILLWLTYYLYYYALKKLIGWKKIQVRKDLWYFIQHKKEIQDYIKQKQERKI